MGYMQSLFGKNTNDDATKQRVLSRLLVDVAEGRIQDGDLAQFCVQHDWSKPEIARRLVHALSKMKAQRVELYPRARAIVERVYTAV